MKESFVFYKSWWTAIKDLPNDVRLEILDGINEYALSGILPEFKPMAKIAFSFIKGDLDRSADKYQKIVDRNRINGKSGGRPKNPNNPVGILETQEKPNYNVNDNYNDLLLEKEAKEISLENLKVDDLVNPEIEERKKVAPKKEIFKPPDLVEVQNYCTERKNNISAEDFLNFYQSKGWMVGTNKMKDWKASVRTWESKNRRNGTNNGFSTAGKNSSGKVSGTAEIAAGITYTEFTRNS